MNKTLLTTILFAATSIGLATVGQAQVQHARHATRTLHSQAMVTRDFQALAPSAVEPRQAGGQDPLDYRLGYFRNF